mgnify:CR=1 FL=1
MQHLSNLCRQGWKFFVGWLFFQLSRGLAPLQLMAPRMRCDVEHVRNGVVIWRGTFFNVVTTVGKTDILDKYLKGAAYTAAWYLGLAGAGTKAAGDTLASHAGWTEVTPYAGNRPSITWGTTSGGSNTATQVSYSINAGATVAGFFVCTAASGTSGTMYNAVDFTGGSRAVVSGDTLNVTPTLTVS